MYYSFIDIDGLYAKRLADEAVIPWGKDGPADRDGAVWKRWAAEGSPRPAAYAAPPLSVAHYRSAIQSHVDATAAERGYDSGTSCASYAVSTNEAWANEALAFIAWRDAVWVHAYDELAKVQSGQAAPPSLAAIVLDLPVLVWPA